MKLHRIPLAVLLIASAPIIAPAAAEPSDAVTIRACLKTEDDAGRGGRSCVGKISDPCMKEPGGDSTVGMTMCLDREVKVWDALLNEEYKQLLAHIDDKAQKKVRAAQRSWIATRDADCEIPYALFEGGTIARPLAVQCLLDETADRALQLRSWREMSGG